MASKKKSRKKKSVTAFEFGAIVPTSKLKFLARPKRGSMYDEFIAKLGDLKDGKSAMMPIPRGVNPRTAHNRLNAAMRRTPPKMRAGLTFDKRTVADGDNKPIAISVSAIKISRKAS